MPHVESRLMLLEPIERRGCRLFELACERDLEGIVAKWADGTYQTDGRSTSWLKIKNPVYSQMEGRHELFVAKRLKSGASRSRFVPPTLALL
jgi:ATP-dependent DNA ligase